MLVIVGRPASCSPRCHACSTRSPTTVCAAFSNAPFGDRNPRLLEPGRIPAGAAADPLSNVVAARSRSQHEALPAALDDLVGRAVLVVRSPSYVGNRRTRDSCAS